MGEILKRLRKRSAREAEEALKRLDEQSDRGPHTFQRFTDAMRRLVAVPKSQVDELRKRQHKLSQAKAKPPART